MSSRALLEVRGVSKSFPGVRALERVDLHLDEGEILAVIGENGAGKSTLMRILAGIESRDDGVVAIDGEVVAPESPREAAGLGIALIHQELNLADNLDAGANVFLGREPRRFGLVDRGAIRAGARSVLERVGADFSPDAPVADLSVGRRQQVEIAKALSCDARILIMDEPTSSLSRAESERLFTLVRALRGRGVGVVYITHRLEEVAELADRVVVLRDGRNAGELRGDEIGHDAMVRLMVGRDLTVSDTRSAAGPGSVRLKVEALATEHSPQSPLSFEVRSGEVVGIAGLIGAGRTEVLETLFGLRPRLSGVVSVDGVALDTRGPRQAIDAGLALVPEDRKRDGLFAEMSVRENVTITGLTALSRAGLLDRRGERRLARDLVERIRVRTTDIEQPVATLSGGNQQKTVLLRWLAVRPRVLLLDDPTRGVDVATRHEIYSMIEELARSGAAVLFASSDLEEVLRLSDRILVMHEGDLAGVLGRAEASEEAVMRLATGARGGAVG